MVNSSTAKISTAPSPKLGAVSSKKLEVGHLQPEVVSVEKKALEKSWFTESDDEDGFNVVIFPRGKNGQSRFQYTRRGYHIHRPRFVYGRGGVTERRSLAIAGIQATAAAAATTSTARPALQKRPADWNRNNSESQRRQKALRQAYVNPNPQSVSVGAAAANIGLHDATRNLSYNRHPVRHQNAPIQVIVSRGNLPNMAVTKTQNIGHHEEKRGDLVGGGQPASVPKHGYTPIVFDSSSGGAGGGDAAAAAAQVIQLHNFAAAAGFSLPPQLLPPLAFTNTSIPPPPPPPAVPSMLDIAGSTPQSLQQLWLAQLAAANQNFHSTHLSTSEGITGGHQVVRRYKSSENEW